MKKAKVRITDYRPPGAGSSRPLERLPARPEAAACSEKERHAIVVRDYSDELLETLIREDQERTAAAAKTAARRGMRYKPDYRDHATRWMAHRISACRAERRRREGAVCA